VFFCNGEWISETPLTPATEVNEKTGVASFHVELPLEQFHEGQYEVHEMAVSAEGQLAAFGQNYLALRLPAGTGSEPALPVNE
jgi:hypothetical protein